MASAYTQHIIINIAGAVMSAQNQYLVSSGNILHSQGDTFVHMNTVIEIQLATKSIHKNY